MFGFGLRSFASRVAGFHPELQRLRFQRQGMKTPCITRVRTPGEQAA